MNKENNIDNISRELINAANITEAPQGFTTNIMSKIEAHKTVVLPILKPLISRAMWLLITIITIVTTTITLFYNNNTEAYFKEVKPSYFNYNFLESIDFTFPSIHLNNITMVAIASFGIFFIIQILMFDKNTRANIS